MAKAERMSSVDTAWLRMDRPGNPMVVVGLFTLGGPLDLTRLEETIAERFLTIPRFRQRVEMRGTEYWWVDDPRFDERRHIRRIRLPGKADEKELRRFVAELASEHLDKERPLWQLHIVEDYRGGAALVFRLHHAVADGMALVGLMLAMTDGGDLQAWTAAARAEPPAWLSLPGIKTLQKSLGATAGLLKEARTLASNPAQTARIGAGVAAELAWLLLMPEDSRTRFKGIPSGNKRVAWTDAIPLDEVKSVGKALGCTVNDVLLASVAGALCEYLKDKGDSIEGVEIRALVPIDLRKKQEAGQLGNKFGIIAVELPVGIENPFMRVYDVHRRMQALKQSLEPPVTLGMLAVLGYGPQMLQDRLFNMLIQRATAVMTNVPGPQTPIFMAGAEIKQVMFWVPQSGDIGMGVSILSYNGMVQFGLVTDAQMVPDPEAIIRHFRPQFDQLLYHVLMSSWGGADAAAAEQPGRYAAAKAAPKPKSRPARKPRAKTAQAKTAPDRKSPPAREVKSEAPARKTPKARPASPRKPAAQAALQAAPEAKIEAKAPKPRKARAASKPRKAGAELKPAAQAALQAAPAPKIEAPVPDARPPRPPSQTRKGNAKPKPQPQPQAASPATPRPQSKARRKLPRT